MKKAAVPPQTALFKKIKTTKIYTKVIYKYFNRKSLFSQNIEVPCELPDRLHFSLQYLSCQIL